MPEPHTSAVVSGVAIGGGVSLSFSLLGASADALVIGMLAAIFVSAWLHKINTLGRAASAVCFSSLLAGYASPAVAGIVAGMLPGGATAESLRMLCALGIGAAAPGVVPLLLTRAETVAKGGNQP